jgi:Domain of unknown function (DUF4336)
MLTQLAEGVWEATSTLKMPLGVRFPIRMTVLRATDGGLALVSPIALDAATRSAVDALGDVRLIVAPNLLHHLFAGAAKEHWPRARLVGPAGLAHKRPDLVRDASLGEGTLLPGITAHAVHGAPSIDEFLVHHAPSRTLVATDLVFNVRRGVGFATWLVFALISGTFGRLAPSRLWRFAVKDRGAFRASLERALASDFDRLVVAHGEVVEAGAKAAMRAALAGLSR